MDQTITQPVAVQTGSVITCESVNAIVVDKAPEVSSKQIQLGASLTINRDGATETRRVEYVVGAIVIVSPPFQGTPFPGSTWTLQPTTADNA